MNWLRSLFFPPEASAHARGVDSLFLAITAVNVVFFLLIAGLVTYFAIRYRRRREGEKTSPVHENLKLELAWTLIPLMIVMGIFFWGFTLYLDGAVAPGDSMEIIVNAKRWVWQFEYPDGTRTLNEIHVPVNTNVRLVMTSEDVIHSFYLPTMRMKTDVLPNRYTDLWFRAEKPGVQQVFCAEYCGRGHSEMMAKVWVDTPEQYKKWVAEGDEQTRSLPLAELGRLVYQTKGCATCHSLDGTRGQGPSFKNVFGYPANFADGSSLVADENYIRESILLPQKRIVSGFEGIMPTFQGLLRERELQGVIAFVKSQSDKAAPQPATPR